MVSIEQQILGLLAMNPDGLSARQLGAELRPVVSQPTLWRRLDELRATGRVRRSGRGRATRYHGMKSDHGMAELRSKALHVEVGKKLLRQPELVRTAQERLQTMRHKLPYAESYLEQWAGLLSGPLEGVLRVLGADDEDSRALRHTSPFAGLLSEQERMTVLRRQGLMR